ncbi:Uncharacterised protein [Moellerella wisconsensis]|nr:Uncharacterised protein [Moellerella wisconsensis]
MLLPCCEFSLVLEGSQPVTDSWYSDTGRIKVNLIANMRSVCAIKDCFNRLQLLGYIASYVVNALAIINCVILTRNFNHNI